MFINKSANDKLLSRSNSQEDIQIRRFIRSKKIDRCHGQGENDTRHWNPEAIRPVRTFEYGLTDARETTLEQAFNAADQTFTQNKAAVPPGTLSHPVRSRRWIHYSTARPHDQSSEVIRPRWYPLVFVHQHDTQVVAPLYRPMSLRPSWTSAERRSHQYYTTTMSAAFTASECSIFWKLFLVRQVESDVCVRLLVTSLAILHEAYNVGDMDTQYALKCESSALLHYNRAIRHISNYAGHMPKSLVTTTCILIVSMEMLRGNVRAAETCSRTGLIFGGDSTRELVEHRWDHPVMPFESASTERAIRVTQAKMSAAFTVFGTGATLAEQKLMFDLTDPRRAASDPSASFQNLNTLAEKLYCTTLLAVNDLRSGNWFERDSALVHSMLQAFTSFLYRLETIRSSDGCLMSKAKLVRQTRVQEMKVLEAQLVFNCICLEQDEMAFDQWNESFQRMVEIARQCLEERNSEPSHLVFHPFSAVFVPPLWLAASRCRCPDIRQRAISLLQTHRRREKAYDSVIASHVGHRIALLEESADTRRSENCHIPRERRIRLVNAEVDAKGSQIQLTYAYGHSRETQLLRESSQWKESGMNSWTNGEHVDLTSLLQALLVYS